MRAISAALLCLFGIGTALALPASAAATTSNTISFVTVSGGFGGCSEFIAYSGRARLAVRSVTDASGGLHIEDFQSNMQGVVGIGDSGATYHFVGAGGLGTWNTRFDEGGAVAITGIGRQRVVGPGPANNTFVDTQFHTTLNANGEVTSSTFEFALTCSNG
jgi:hypothetical protein